MNEHRSYLSPLSEQELYDLWMELKEERPILYEKYCNPDYSRPDFEDELRSVDGGIGAFVGRKFPSVRFYPEQNNIHDDMLTFHVRYLGKTGLGWESK